MAKELQIASIADAVLKKFKQFRFRKEKTLAALLLKINKNNVEVELEQEWEETTIEEIIEEIPHQQPRYIVLSYPLNHSDGRVSFPQLFVFISPQGCNPEQQMMYAGTKLSLVNSGGFTKVVEYRNIEEFTDEGVRAFLTR